MAGKRLSEWVLNLAYAEKWLVLGTIIGIVAGFTVLVFFELLTKTVAIVAGFLGVQMTGKTTDLSIVFIEAKKPLLEFLVLMAGVVLSAPIVYRIAPEAEGGGTESAVFAYHNRAAIIPLKVPIVKLIASVLTIGTGTSAGVEGPSVHMGAGAGSILARALGLSRRDRAIAFVAGISAALAAAFRAPLGSAFFATEVLYKRDLEAQAFMPAFISSLVAYAVTAPYFKFIEPLPRITVPASQIYSANGLLTLLGLGVFVAPFVYLFIISINGVNEYFRRLARRLGLPLEFKAILGGLVGSLIIVALPIAAGSARKMISASLNGEIFKYISASDTTTLIIILVIAAIAKFLATSFMVGSGVSGGVFAPSLLSGALLGWAYYLILGSHASLPGNVYAYIGMAAFFGAAGKVPLAVSIIIGEMSRNYYLIAPTLAAAYIAREIVGEATVYPPQRETRPVI